MTQKEIDKLHENKPTSDIMFLLAEEFKLSGKFIRWHDNGEKHIERNYKNGKQNDKYTRWYTNGEKEEEGNYNDGKLDGKYTLWLPNRKIWKKAIYKNGILINQEA